MCPGGSEDCFAVTSGGSTDGGSTGTGGGSTGTGGGYAVVNAPTLMRINGHDYSVSNGQYDVYVDPKDSCINFGLSQDTSHCSIPTTYSYVCLPIAAHITGCNETARRRLADELVDIVIEVADTVLLALPDDSKLVLMTQDATGNGVPNSCATSYFDATRSALVGEDCTPGVYFLGVVDAATLASMGLEAYNLSVMDEEGQVMSVSSSSTATPAVSATPTSSPPDGISAIGNDGGVETNDGHPASDNTTVVVVAGVVTGLAIVAAASGGFVYSKHKKTEKVKKAKQQAEEARQAKLNRTQRVVVKPAANRTTEKEAQREVSMHHQTRQGGIALQQPPTLLQPAARPMHSGPPAESFEPAPAPIEPQDDAVAALFGGLDADETRGPSPSIV